MKHYRKELWIAAAAVFVLTGCGKGKGNALTPVPTANETEILRPEPTSEPTPEPSPTPLDMKGLKVVVADWWSDENWNDPGYNQYLIEKVDQMEEDEKIHHFSFDRVNPGYGIDAEYAAKVAEAIRADQPPGNLIAIELKDVGKLLCDGLLRDVSGVTSIDWEDAEWSYFINSTDMMKINGKQYGFHALSGYAGLGFFFNKSILKDCGIDPELLYDMQRENRWDWNSFLEICGKLLKDTDGDGTVDIRPLLAEGRLAVYGTMLSNAAFVIEQDERNLLKMNASDPAVKEALAFVQELADKGYLVSTEGDDIKAFLEGKCAMWIDDGWEFPADQMQEAGIDYGFVSLPYGPSAGRRVTVKVNDIIYFVPNCESTQGLENELLFAYYRSQYIIPCYGNEPYDDSAGWLRPYNYGGRFTDDDAISDTIRFMATEKGKNPYYTAATCLLADFDDSWVSEILDGRDINQVLAFHEDEWQKQVDEFNMLFD